MRIALGSDHRGFPYKSGMIAALRADGPDVLDPGTNSTAAVDYPETARDAGLLVRDRLADGGALVCGSGAGVSIAANRTHGVRAALCHDLCTAHQCREDDDATVLCLGSRVVALDMAIELAREFIAARFTHAERRERRLA